MDADRLPILCVPSAALTPVAIVVGDPERAARTADLLDDPERLGANREYVTFSGTRGGVRLTVASHGVGAAGANVCFAELLRGGCARSSGPGRAAPSPKGCATAS